MWRGHELFVSSLPLLVEYIPATLFYFLDTDGDLTGLRSPDLPGAGGKKEPALLAGFSVCFLFQRNAGTGSDLYRIFRTAEAF